MKELSVIIINYHTFDLTTNCLRSIQSKTNYTNYEIVLVDNGSSAEEESKFKSLFPEIIYIKSETNLGFSRGNNLGIRKSTGEFILLLNSDTELLNDAFENALNILRADENIGVVSGQLQFPDGEIQPVARVFPTLSGVLKEFFRITRLYSKEKQTKFYLADKWDYGLSVDADWVWGAFFMFRRKDLELFPGNKLHEDFFMYQEDVQWCYHFKKVLQKRIRYTPEAKLIHFMGKSDKETTDSEVKYFQKLLPNEHSWIRLTKGKIYASTYYLVKSLYYFSLRRKSDREKAKKFLQYVC